MKRRIGGRLTLTATLGLAALLASACSSTSASSSSSGAGKLTTVTVGVLPISDNAPFFIAVKKGYFKQEGLNVKYTIINQSTSAIPDMVNGTVDIAAGGNYVSWLQAVSQGLPLRIVAPSDQCAKGNLVVLALPNSGIKTAQNLVGKTVAVNLPGNIQTLTINAVLQAENINPTKYTPVKIPFPNMPSELAAKQVDAIATVEPFITTVEEKMGAVPVLDECQGPTSGISVSGYWADNNWVKKNGSTALAFQKAIFKAQAAADANRKLVEEVLPSYTKITPKIAALMSLPYYPTTFDTTQLQRVADLMLSQKLITKPLNVASVVFH